MISIRLLTLRLLCGVAAILLLLQIRQGGEISRYLASYSAVGDAGTGATVLVDDDEDDITTLPAALQPSNFTQCCTKLSTNPKVLKSTWKTTCHTEQACENNTLYPFHSEEEKEFLETYIRFSAERAEHRRICQEAANELNPEVTWCKIKVRGSNNASRCVQELQSLSGNNGFGLPFFAVLARPESSILGHTSLNFSTSISRILLASPFRNPSIPRVAVTTEWEVEADPTTDYCSFPLTNSRFVASPRAGLRGGFNFCALPMELEIIKTHPSK